MAPDPVATVLVVDDDASVREALATLLESAGWRVAAFASAEELELCTLPEVAACILDVKLPDTDGLDLQRQMLCVDPTLPIIFISGHSDIPTSVRAMKAGAVEFLPKPVSSEELLTAVGEAVQRSRRARERQDRAAQLLRCYGTLTERERQVMGRIVAGRMNKQVAAELGLQLVTIKVYRGRVMAKMGARSLAELVQMAATLGDEGTMRPVAPGLTSSSS